MGTSTRPETRALGELVICSLEAWDDVWRRNQFLVAELLRLEPDLRVLFVEPPRDVPFELLTNHRVHTGRGLRKIGHPGAEHLFAFEPTKWLPRVVGPFADRAITNGVRHAARSVGFHDPVLWVNDLALTELAVRTRWPTLYDVTDDWLLASASPRELARRTRSEQALLGLAAEVVVCSPALVGSKGAHRTVRLIPNAVDLEHLRAPTERPLDLPTGPIVCYVGTLHADRLDIDLCVQLARGIAGAASIVYVGPDSLDSTSRRRLAAESGTLLLGARPHQSVAAYLQHADVLITPHVISPFTESLDPIKAYEYRSVGRPVVSTPVAGFRELGPPVVIAQGSAFVESVRRALKDNAPAPTLLPVPTDAATWAVRAEEMRSALQAARGRDDL